jgi:hypothetical protein
MPSKKIISDIYTIKAPEVVIDGNLIVSGSSTEVTTTNTSITDKTIVLNKGGVDTLGNVGILGPDHYSGIEVERSITGINNVGIRFNEDPAGDGSELPSWEITDDGVTWKYILSSGTPGGAGMTEVEDDPAPKLGGNLNITSRTLYNTDSNVIVYTSNVAQGGTGVFVDNNEGTQEELISKRKAIIYSLIF